MVETVSRAAQLRQMREARFSKSSSGGVEGHASRTQAERGIPRPEFEGRACANPKGVDGSHSLAGVKPGPLDVKRGRPRLGDKHERHEPWKTLGLTERTYYRRKAEQRRADGSR